MWLLHQFPLCPFSRKIRLLLSEKNIPFDLVREGESVGAFRTCSSTSNPAGRTPVIVNPEKHITLPDSRCDRRIFRGNGRSQSDDQWHRHPAARKSAGWWRCSTRIFYADVTAPLLSERMRKRIPATATR